VPFDGHPSPMRHDGDPRRSSISWLRAYFGPRGSLACVILGGRAQPPMLLITAGLAAEYGIMLLAGTRPRSSRSARSFCEPAIRARAFNLALRFVSCAHPLLSESRIPCSTELARSLGLSRLARTAGGRHAQPRSPATRSCDGRTVRSPAVLSGFARRCGRSPTRKSPKLLRSVRAPVWRPAASIFCGGEVTTWKQEDNIGEVAPHAAPR
jgi:hypothetical protein